MRYLPFECLVSWLIKTYRSLKSQSSRSHHVGHRRSTLRAQSHSANPNRYVGDILIDEVSLSHSSQLKDLDLYLHCGDLPLRDVAAQDSLFLQHDFHFAGAIRTTERAYCILDLTNALLRRIQNMAFGDSIRKANGSLSCDNFKCEKFVANLEHLLRYLRQIALDAIVRHCVDFVILYWHDYWQHQRRMDEGWFAEWPNGQRPLSTTWPWNVKPSLLVLWGVCWMFYGQNASNTGHSRETRNRRGAAHQVESGSSGGDFRTRQFVTHSEPAPLQPGSSLGSKIMYFY